MKNKVILPASACAALPLLWAILPSSGLGSAAELGAPSPAAQEAAPTGPSPTASAQRLDPLIEAVSAPSLDESSRTAVAAKVPLPDPNGKVAAPELPKELKLSDVGPEIAARLDSSLALFDEPTDEMYAAWYAGSNLEELARVHFDSALAANAFTVLEWSRQNDPSAAVDYGLGRLVELRASFEQEFAWLNAEVHRRIQLGGTPSGIVLAPKSDDELCRAFPGPSDRNVLRVRMLQEFNALAREAASDKFAKIRAMSSEDRVKHSTPFLS